MSKLPVIDYAPLDPDTYALQSTLFESLHCARPVMVHGQQEYIQALGPAEIGGRIEMTVYLKGGKVVDASEVVARKCGSLKP